MWALASINKNVESKEKQLSLFANDNIDEKFYAEVIAKIGFMPESYQTNVSRSADKYHPASSLEYFLPKQAHHLY